MFSENSIFPTCPPLGPLWGGGWRFLESSKKVGVEAKENFWVGLSYEGGGCLFEVGVPMSTHNIFFLMHLFVTHYIII